MSGRATRRLGVLIPIRKSMRSRWASVLLLTALCASPWAAAEATIAATGRVSAGSPTGPIDISTIFTPFTSAGPLTYTGFVAVAAGGDGTSAVDGTLTVNGGSQLTITGPANSAGPGLLIGGTAVPVGGTEGQGIVTIDGAGSLIQALNSNIDPNRGFVHVGQWGANSVGTLNITNGGAVRASTLVVADGQGFVTNISGTLTTTTPNSPSTGTVLVDGIGSSITLSGFNSTGQSAQVIIGRTGGNGSVTVQNGALAGISGVGATSVFPGFNVGFGAMGALKVTGVPGALPADNTTINITGNQFGGGMVIGNTQSITQPLFSAPGTGTVTFESGANVTITSSPFAASGFNLGIGVGSTGTLNVTSGATVAINADLKGGGFTIGNTGTGTMTVTGAGTGVLQDGTTTPGATPGITIGSAAGSMGTLTIQGGAVWTLNRSGAGCCMTVGRAGLGVLTILNGGQMTLNDSSTSGGGGISFGLNDASTVPTPPTLTAGTFNVLISGPGSTLSVYGIDAGFTLGAQPGSSGTMTVDNGGAVNADVFGVGNAAGSTATMTVSGAGTTVNLVGDPDGSKGAGFAVGAGGTGDMFVTAGAVITIDGTATPQIAGFTVGGSRLAQSGGTGTLTVDGAGSKVIIAGTQKGFNVGFDNTCLSGGPCNMPSTGTLTVSNGGQVLTDPDNRSGVGSTPGSTGTLIVEGGGSLVDAGAFLGLGKDRDGNLGGTATLTVSAGGTVKADVINCGAGGTINGNGGTIIGDVIADPGCVIAPGLSPGTLSIIGTLTGAGAKIVLEVDAFGNHDVLAVQGTTAFDPSTQIEVRVDPAFQPAGGSLLQLVQVQATPTDLVLPLLTLLVSSSGGGTVTATGDLKTLSDPIAVVPDITIDPTVRMVEIDIKPGEFPNVIHLGAQGTLPVAIISTAAFDALSVDAQTISLHSVNSTTWTPNAKLVGKGDRAQCSTQDVNGDGRPDLLCHIVISTLPLAGESIAVLDAMAFTSTGPSGGIPIRGADFIKIVP